MKTLLRWALLLVIGMLLVGVVARGVSTSGTGVMEKLVLIVAGVLLLAAASFVHRIGRTPAD